MRQQLAFFKSLQGKVGCEVSTLDSLTKTNLLKPIIGSQI